MSFRAIRFPLVLLVPAFLSSPVPGGALPGTDDNVLVFFLGGVPLKVGFERFARPLPLLTAAPGGGGANQLSVQDTKGTEVERAPERVGPGSFVIVRRLDSASPRLYQFCSNGTHLQKTRWKNLVLKQARISKYALDRSGAVAIETIEIAYEGIGVTP
jgi:hypothetical protein